MPPLMYNILYMIIPELFVHNNQFKRSMFLTVEFFKIFKRSSFYFFWQNLIILIIIVKRTPGEETLNTVKTVLKAISSYELIAQLYQNALKNKPKKICNKLTCITLYILCLTIA